MIPVKLTLKNFMSYGDEATALPFEGLHVACLSGDNGNGKSALLDAMTWSLWGKTRASAIKAVSEDDLIRVGAEEMEVRFEFELNDSLYRVVRKRKRGKTAGTSDWQLAQADASGEWLPIGGGSQRETAKQVTQLLSMEYETFLNSAYLQQGHADEFTRQTPDKRKGILAEILNLQRFDRLEEKAKAKVKERKEVVDELASEIKMLDNDIARLPQYEEELKATHTALEEMTTQAEQQEKEVNALRASFHKLEERKSQERDAEDRCRKIGLDIETLNRELIVKNNRLREMQETLQQKASILQDYRALEEAEKKRDALEPEIVAYNQAEKDLQAVRNEIEKERLHLQSDLRLQESHLQNLARSCERLATIETQMGDLAATLTEEAKLTAQWEAATQEQEQAREAFAALKARNEQITDTIREIEEVLDLLSRPHATCPICASDLSGEKHARVLASQEKKKAQALAEQESLKPEGRTRKQALTEAENAVAALQKRREELIRHRTRHQELAREKQSLGDVATERKTLAKQVETLRNQLEKEEFAAPRRVQKQRLEKELERLATARHDYEMVTQRIGQLKTTRERFQQLRTAECDWEQAVHSKQQTEKQMEEKRKEEVAERKRFAELQAQLAQYDTIRQKVQTAESQWQQSQRELNRLRADETRFQTYITKCQQAMEQRKEREARRKVLMEEGRTYHALAQAFGKGGIQTYIIENAIPEIEDEANDLLARITDNAMSLRFRTTRSARATKSEIETLDIQIQDNAGIRPYELFSGGEGFRINFAIRIALSRLLARRSGAKLQTLILDEGFGSQDGKGRERMVEVIESIKDDFAKILVITHFEEMKDAFPQRIEIIKDANGSRIHLL